jgi:hypothetical protein
MGLGPNGLLGGLGNAAPTGTVQTTGLTGMDVRGFGASTVGGLNSGLATLAQQQAGSTQTGGISSAPTLGGVAPGQGPAPNMGAPAAGLAVSPRGNFGPSNASPVGSTVGQATISSPSGGPDAPSAMATNAGLGSAATNAQSQTNSTSGGTTAAPAPSTVAQVQAASPDFGSIFQLIMSLVSGGAGGPQLSNLAQAAARPQLAATPPMGG